MQASQHHLAALCVLRCACGMTKGVTKELAFSLPESTSQCVQGLYGHLRSLLAKGSSLSLRITHYFVLFALHALTGWQRVGRDGPALRFLDGGGAAAST